MARRLQSSYYKALNLRVFVAKPSVSNYRILLRGVKPGRSIEEVVTALARYSKKPPDALRSLLRSGKPLVAKRTTEAQQATRYKLLLEKLGCDCLIEAEITERADSANTTSVLVTESYSDPQSVPRRGVTYAQQSRFGALVEALHLKAVAVLAVLLGAAYYGWRYLQ